MKRLLGTLVSIAVITASTAAAANVEITSVNADAYPRAQATVVTSPPTRFAPELTENGAPATGLVAENVGHEKSVVLLVDHSRSMRGVSLKNAIAAAQAFAVDKALNDKIAVVAFGKDAVALTDLSASGSDATAALAGIRVDPAQGTALFDSITLASKQL